MSYSFPFAVAGTPQDGYVVTWNAALSRAEWTAPSGGGSVAGDLVKSVEIADDDNPVTLLELSTFPSSVGEESIGVAGVLITPTDPSGSPSGTISLFGPSGASGSNLDMTFGPIAAGETEFVPLMTSDLGPIGSNPWKIDVVVDNGTGSCYMDAEIIVTPATE
jgi:hypothetical protein